MQCMYISKVIEIVYKVHFKSSGDIFNTYISKVIEIVYKVHFKCNGDYF